MVRYLKERGISAAVGVLFYGQGIYVWLSPKLSDMTEVRALANFDRDELDEAFKIWFLAFNDLLADIEKAICDTFGLEPESLQSNRKARSVSHPRMLAMWLARKYTRAALSEIGERGKARALCERLLAVAGSLDLYAEELDTETNQHLGNFPQAFTHLALINAVSHVIADENRDDEADGPTAVFSEMRN